MAYSQNASELKEFEVMQIFRSDGVDSGPGYWAEPLKKTTKTSGGKDVVSTRKVGLSRLDDSDPRFNEWRLKLGLLLKQELSPAPQEGLPWFVPFPKGYWLYEKSKHFLVSGYPIKGKLYKTPQEFGVHLLWLLSSSEDRRDCCCIFCNTPDTEANTSSSNTSNASNTNANTNNAATKAADASKTGPLSAATTTGPSQGQTTAAGGQEASTKISTLKNRKPARLSATGAVSPAVYQPPARMPTVSALFRTGELVWYSHEQSWRIGLITISESTWHQITPIGHASVPMPKINKAPTDIRPFLAFSVPQVSQEALKGLSFDDVPWGDRVRPLQAAGNHNAVESLMLDASKLGALKINRSYSFFNRFGANNGTTSYKGIFLGAERIHVDDVLRISQTPPGQPPQNAQQPEAMDMVHFLLKGIYTMEASAGTLFFHGDVVRLVQSPVPEGSSILTPEGLPPVLLEEATYRNNSSTAAAWKWHWVAVEKNTWRREPDIKGRFYSMPRLGPILLAPQMKAGPRDKVAPALNGRLDAVLYGPNVGETKTRAETVRDIIPEHAVFKFDEQEVQFENDV
ncbi:Transcription-silencing protein Clr2 [Ceratocystis platani]|uniref:Transcription-silencing protein Clr2 n=1 Tax=Ceratocystis fimbriata f. sp. platani TaxID=88771 RepID=A0A0F8CSP3_CERFI|nr:Transcription-silencing protein Clr2 [Ceratocystis platani]